MSEIHQEDAVLFSLFIYIDIYLIIHYNRTLTFSFDEIR